MKTRPLRVGYRCILVIIAMAMLSSCDGGIFGTGDGSIETAPDNVDSGSPGPVPPAGTESPDDENQSSPDTQPDDSDNDLQVETIPFENLLIGGDSTQPLITLINFSAIALNAITGADYLFTDAIMPGGVSNYAGVALDSMQLSIIEGNTEDPLVVLAPLNLGAFSVSTLIARDRLPGSAGEQSTGDTRLDVEIVALASLQKPIDDGVARVRLLLVSPLDDDDQPASMSLVPADASPGGSEAELGIVSAATLGSSADYRMVAPGSYRLVDSLERLPSIPVELTGGEFHTLLLTGSPTQLLVLRDSRAANPIAARP